MKTLVFLYEPEQVEHFLRLPRAAAGEEREVVACELGVEFLLQEKSISFSSARTLRRTPVSERLTYGGALSRALLHDPQLSFFSYRGVALGTVFSTALQYYLATFLYSLDIVAGALDVSACDRTVMFTPTSELKAGGMLGAFSMRAYVDALQLACAQKNIECVIKDVSPKQNISAFGIKRLLFGWGIGALNTLVSVTVPRKKIRILASENWKNIAPLMAKLPDSELALFDRTESLVVGLRGIWRNRTRFIHSDHFLSSKVRSIATEKSRECIATWNVLESTYQPLLGALFCGYKLEPLLQRVLLHLFGPGAEQAVCDIEGVYTLCAKLKPHVVIVRASASAQTHFAILCKVAKQLEIPSIEIQHGTLYFGSGSYSQNPAAEYIAEYGPLVHQDFKTIGYDDAHLFDVGSPRFDLYTAVKPPMRNAAAGRFSVVCIAPNITHGFVTDSYDVLDFFKGLACAVRDLPGIFLIIKLRADHPKEALTRAVIDKALSGVPYAISQYDSLANLFAESDAVVSCPSTALIEGMLAGKPTVYFSAGLPLYDVYAATPENNAAIRAGALIVAKTSEELVQVFSHLAKDKSAGERIASLEAAFIKQQYSFDGKSATRLAEAVRTLARRRV
ncbi:MAG: hypothetical protein ABSE76_01110 [Minisyncoccia bacterium]|jgi:hypothetical protein